MGNRHYHGDGGQGNRDEPSVEASGVRIVFAWIVALMFLATAQGGLRDPAGAFVIFVVLFPVIALLMLGVVAMGLWTLVAAVRGSGPGPGNLMFWMEVLPTAIGTIGCLSFLSSLSEPW